MDNKSKPRLKKSEVEELIGNVSNIRDKALFSFLYLTGCRVGEVIKRVTIKDIEPITKFGKLCYRFYLYTEKKPRNWKEANSERLYRRIVIPFDSEPKLLKMILDYIDLLKIKGTTILFNLSRGYVWYLCKKRLGFNPHWLRHLRSSHLVDIYNFNPYELKEWHNWSNTIPADTYVKPNEENMIKKQIGII